MNENLLQIVEAITQSSLPSKDSSTQYPIDVATLFFTKICPDILTSPLFTIDDDRLIKAGRSILDLVSASYGTDDGAAGLNLLVEEYSLLAADPSTRKVPKVRFGRTEIQIPIVTLGGMRLQQEWGPRITSMSEVSAECQSNLVRIIRHAVLDLGINHIETARAYGCSELQYGAALEELFASGDMKREDLIIQTKVAPKPTAAEFRETLELSFKEMRLDYIDLFAFHGCNLENQFDLIFNNGENGDMMDVVREYVADGRIRHVGFSTHGTTDVILKFVATGEFDYANVHYHYFGSYTASCDGADGCGNRAVVRLMKEKDMGVFVISPYDKGGKLYAPSKKLRSLTLPDMEPVGFGSFWLWQHERLDEERAPVHTIVCGAARPSDLDNPAMAAIMQGSDPDGVEMRVRAVVERLERAQQAALGKEWLSTCHVGLPNWKNSKSATHHTHIVSLYNLILSFGMLDYAKERYGSMEENLKAYDPELSQEANVDKLSGGMWGWCPGYAVRPELDYIEQDFLDCPEENRTKLMEAITSVHKWCGEGTKPDSKEEKKSSESDAIPDGCQMAYDMRPWTAFPERPTPENS